MDTYNWFFKFFKTVLCAWVLVGVWYFGNLIDWPRTLVKWGFVLK